MVKKSFLFLIFLAAIATFTAMAYSQTAKKTITLPNGEVVWDLNGEWDVFVENYGIWSSFGRGMDLAEVTQQGSSFEGIRMMGTGSVQRGKVSIRGELEKNGFKKIQIYYINGNFSDGKGQISEDGNRMIIDDGEKFRVTYTRK